MRTAKEIRQYLRQQRWNKEYIYNARRFGTVYRMIDTNHGNDFIRGYEKIRTICAAFIWSKTIEGSDVWNLRDINFRKWYSKGGKKYEKRRY